MGFSRTTATSVDPVKMDGDIPAVSGSAKSTTEKSDGHVEVEIARLGAPHIWTPLVKSHKLSRKFGQCSNLEVYLKLDCLQPSGSFKLRGIGQTVKNVKAEQLRYLHSRRKDGSDQKAPPRPIKNVVGCVCSSGGNAGLACAYACQFYGLKCVIVLPTSTPRFCIALLEQVNPQCKVIIHGSVWNEADVKARELSSEEVQLDSLDSNSQAQEVQLDSNSEEVLRYVSPFDQPSTWTGHSSVVTEIKQDLHTKFNADLHALVTVCGGGGLSLGILEGIEREYLGNSGANTKSSSGSAPPIPKVLIGETHGANCLAASFKQKEHIQLPTISSIAKSLGALQVSKTLYDKLVVNEEGLYNVQLLDDIDSYMTTGKADAVADKKAVVSPEGGAAAPRHDDSSSSSSLDVFLYETTDKQALEAVLDLLDDQQLLVEPACGAGLRAVYGRADFGGNVNDVTSDGGPGEENEGNTVTTTQRKRAIVVEVCGGKMVSRSLLDEWERKLSG